MLLGMTLITSPFDDTTTALEVVADVDLTGRRALVTGGASGIGVETARALAGAGAARARLAHVLEDAAARREKLVQQLGMAEEFHEVLGRELV